jgi:tetratricopeptide (TPR) repeat protein
VESVTEDPAFAPAWARLGRCYRMTAKFQSRTIDEVRENLKRADLAFRKAFELNPDLPLAHHLYTALETDLGRAEQAVLRLVRRTRQRRADPAVVLFHKAPSAGKSVARSTIVHFRGRKSRNDPQRAGMNRGA